jgi:hypothetical protein
MMLWPSYPGCLPAFILAALCLAYGYPESSGG